MPPTENEQTNSLEYNVVGFERPLSIYAEENEGIPIIPIEVFRNGSTEKALRILVLVTEPIFGGAPSSQMPTYQSVFEVLWKGGEGGTKEVKVAIKPNAVFDKPVVLELELRVAASAPAVIEKGRAFSLLKVVNRWIGAVDELPSYESAMKPLTESIPVTNNRGQGDYLQNDDLPDDDISQEMDDDIPMTFTQEDSQILRRPFSAPPGF